MDLISVITPYHKPYEKYLMQAHACLKAQTHENWQWILVPNGKARVPEKLKEDKRVKVVRLAHAENTPNKIGWLKRNACLQADGEIIFEFDADDILLPGALIEVQEAMNADRKKVFAYSNSAMFNEKTWESEFYTEYWGWRRRDFHYNGHKLNEMIGWPPSPHMMRFVYWAPNHLRAWRKQAYLDVGGHDESLFIGDDHDLCCRFFIRYGAEGFQHIDQCLYLYQTHDENACNVWNRQIQDQTMKNYLRYSRPMAVKWAIDEGLARIDLGGRFDKWPEFLSIDIQGDADISHDLNETWPLADNSVGVLRASHILEHLRDPIFTMNEAYRVLAPGGWFFIDVPSTEGRGAFQDPTHVSFWNENSFLYYTNKEFARFIKPAMKCRFQKSRIVTFFPSKEWEDLKISVVQADLIALKSPYDKRPPGEVLI